MQIDLTIDGVAAGTIRGLAHLADMMSRLQPGQTVALKSGGTERFLADRVEAIARRRHHCVAWEGTPTEHTLRFRLEPGMSPAEPAQTAARVGGGGTKLEQRDVGTGVETQHPPTALTAPQNQVRSANSTGPDSVQTHLSEWPPERGRPEASGPRLHGLARNPGEPTTVSPEGEVVPLCHRTLKGGHR
jgi:hypothetical protein